LDWYELRLPDLPALQAVVERLHAAGMAPEQEDARWIVRDPSQNRLVLTAE